MDESNIDCTIKHDNNIKITKLFPKDETIGDLANFFKILGDSTRIKILFALSNSELCVHEISDLLGMSQSSISHQLRVLRDNKLVKSKRLGKMISYSLADQHVESVIQQSLEHFLE
ncbi:MAG: metalloregulator ArsR/SmtB family transcription factor [Spirochaetota bacterium]|nr:metalloregulator ArsR/SmtB family transcription factor [Spirochaetota bacterium]